MFYFLHQVTMDNVKDMSDRDFERVGVSVGEKLTIQLALRQKIVSAEGKLLIRIFSKAYLL